MTLNDAGTKVTHVRLASGDAVACGTVVNASGTRGARTARMAGIELPIEARKRYTFVFSAARPLIRDLPLTIDPSGVHMRTDNRNYMAGCPPDDDSAVDPDDFTADHALWEDKVWPVLAHRVPQFDAIRLINSWVGHYDYNTLDQNAVIGRHPQVTNFLFTNGFSGHGLQQSPALGRGTAELIIHGRYRSLDLSEFHYERIAATDRFSRKQSSERDWYDPVGAIRPNVLDTTECDRYDRVRSTQPSLFDETDSDQRIRLRSTRQVTAVDRIVRPVHE